MIASLLGAWTGVALSNYGVWSDTASDPALNTSGINARFSTPGDDALRDRHEPQRARPVEADGVVSGRAGLVQPARARPRARPTTDTGNALVDAYLWVKVPGESDGSCNRGVSGSTTDPEWGGTVDPAAGAWFPQQALQLAQLASPALLP